MKISKLIAGLVLGALVALVGLFASNTIKLNGSLGALAAMAVIAPVASKLPTLAQIEKEEKEIADRAAKLKESKAAVLKAETDKVAGVLDSFPAQLSKIMGRPVDMKEAISLAGQRLRGTFGSLTARTSTPGGNPLDKGKRLTDEQKDAVRADMLKRAGDLKAGRTPEQMTVIAARHGISAQTLDTYKPTAEQVAALPGDKEVPATAIAKAATA